MLVLARSSHKEKASIFFMCACQLPMKLCTVGMLGNDLKFVPVGILFPIVNIIIFLATNTNKVV